MVGPNNGGKTTVCDAMEIFFNHLSRRHLTSFMMPRRRRNTVRNEYNPVRDYPAKIVSGRRWPTTFTAIFELDEYEKEFLQEIKGVRIAKGTLVIRLKWAHKKDRLIFNIDGLSGDSPEPNRPLNQILEFVASRIQLIVVPAIRDQESWKSNVQYLIDESVSTTMEKSQKISRLRKKLQTAIEPELKKVSTEVERVIKSHISLVKGVEFDWEVNLSRSVEVSGIKLDDGFQTPIELKGDGVKSLLVLAQLTQIVSKDNQENPKLKKSKILLIEEPEAHLNSSFLYTLREKLRGLSEHSQVITTTHSPVFVDFRSPKNVFIVSSGEIKNAESKASVADSLGIRLQENLVSNFKAIIFEGPDDETAFRVAMKNFAPKASFDEFDIFFAAGASKVPSLYLSQKNFYQEIFVVLDSDAEGKKTLNELQNLGLGTRFTYLCPTELDFKESELEDVLELSAVLDILSSVYGRPLSLESARVTRRRYKAKFSDWIVKFVQASGVPVSDKQVIKRTIWDGIAQRQILPLTELGNQYFQSVVGAMLPIQSNTSPKKRI